MDVKGGGGHICVCCGGGGDRGGGGVGWRGVLGTGGGIGGYNCNDVGVACLRCRERRRKKLGNGNAGVAGGVGCHGGGYISMENGLARYEM